jgi:triosephosphate isomerase
MGILYGGSVKPENAKGLLRAENVDGALVCGASLDAGEFLAVAGVYRDCERVPAQPDSAVPHEGGKPRP